MDSLVIFERNERAVTSSRTVAKDFKKQHQHVTQAIENLISENSLVKPMFEKTTYLTERGREYKITEICYLMLVKSFRKILENLLTFRVTITIIFV